MKKLSRADIADEYNKHSQTFRAVGESTGFAAALQQISQAIDDLKKSDIDISLDISAIPHEISFVMFTTPATVPVCGTLRIGNNTQLFAICVSEGETECLKLGLTRNDISTGIVDGTRLNDLIRAKPMTSIYDLQKDPEALIKFQRDIIKFAARNDVVLENDTADAFDGNNKIRKPLFKHSP